MVGGPLRKIRSPHVDWLFLLHPLGGTPERPIGDTEYRSAISCFAFFYRYAALLNNLVTIHSSYGRVLPWHSTYERKIPRPNHGYERIKRAHISLYDLPQVDAAAAEQKGEPPPTLPQEG